MDFLRPVLSSVADASRNMDFLWRSSSIVADASGIMDFLWTVLSAVADASRNMDFLWPVLSTVADYWASKLSTSGILSVYEPSAPKVSSLSEGPRLFPFTRGFNYRSRLIFLYRSGVFLGLVVMLALDLRVDILAFVTGLRFTYLFPIKS